MNLFTKETLEKCTFSWQELNGKTLEISVARHYDDIAKESLTTVIGRCKTTGKCYVLVNEIKRL
jgi:hypothetical protein